MTAILRMTFSNAFFLMKMREFQLKVPGGHSLFESQ